MASRTVGRLVIVAAVVSSFACGGGYNTPTSSTPPPPPSGSAGLTIAIQATSGAQSFTPNPAAAANGQGVAWRNNDRATHRIVANDGSFDTGDIAPGATSSAVGLPRGTNYHCAIHPSMVGAIGVAAEPPPPCSGPYCS